MVWRLNSHLKRIGALGSMALSSMLLASCDQEERLPGTRLAVFAADDSLLVQGQTEPVALSAPYVNADWSMQGGSNSHAMYHLALADAPAKAWGVDIGVQENAQQKITAQPIVANNFVYAMDANLNVSARRLTDGELVWRVNVGDADETSNTFGGGMAFGDGRLYVATGDSELFAMNPATGQAVWRARLLGPARGGVTFFQGRLYIQTLNNKTEAFHADTGRSIWQHQGIEEVTSIVGSSAPATDGQVVYVTYSSGEVYALIAETGGVIWTDIISPLGAFSGRLQQEISDIQALPVIDRGLLIVTSNGGRTVGYDIQRGLPAWEYTAGGTQTPAVSTEHIFLVTNDGTAVALQRSTGRAVWVKDLGSNATRSGVKKIEWFGPIIASNRLLFGSSLGHLIALSPFDGRLLGEISLGSGLSVPPVVANQNMIFLTQSARLLNYR